MIIQTGHHYLYRHIRIDKDEPFYIGIGTRRKDRKYSENYPRAYYKRGRGSIWHYITNKYDYEVEIMLESDDYDFIKKKEKEFILLYGRINKGTGCLANLTDGGDGTIGCIPTVYARELASKRFKGKKRDSASILKTALKRKKKVHQYSLLGEYIKTYESCREASQELLIEEDGISGCARGDMLSYKSYLWKYGKPLETISPYKPGRKTCRVKNKETGEIYESILEAELKLGKNKGVLKSALHRNRECIIERIC